MMTLSPAGAADVRLHEGFVGKYYLDAATPPVGTIGVGFTWGSAAFRKWWGMVRGSQKFGPGAVMTRTEADEVLQLLAAEEYGLAVNHFLDKDVPQNVFDASTSMVFNCGTGALTWKWAAAMKDGDYKKAANLLETTAIKAGGNILKGLISRRKDEARLMRDGIYATGDHHMPADDDKSDDDGILERGERGLAVKKLQTMLEGAGFYDGIIDGIFGFGTDTAVRQFQAVNKLDADGKAGSKTLKLLAA